MALVLPPGLTAGIRSTGSIKNSYQPSAFSTQLESKTQSVDISSVKRQDEYARSECTATN